jgi:hypothetical protein
MNLVTSISSALRSGHRLLQRPSPGKQFPSSLAVGLLTSALTLVVSTAPAAVVNFDDVIVTPANPINNVIVHGFQIGDTVSDRYEPEGVIVGVLGARAGFNGSLWIGAGSSDSQPNFLYGSDYWGIIANCGLSFTFVTPNTPNPQSCGSVSFYVDDLNDAANTVGMWTAIIYDAADNVLDSMVTNAQRQAFSFYRATNDIARLEFYPSSELEAIDTLSWGGPQSPNGNLAFAAPAYTFAESAGTVTITVERTGASAGPVSVSYAAVAGTATAGLDYQPATGVLTFADGVAQQTFTLTLLDDSALEGNETVTLWLTNPTGGAILGPQQPVTLTIQDVEAGVLEFDAPVFSVNETGPNATIRIARRISAAGSVGVDYAVYSETATVGVDLPAATGHVTLADGVTSATIQIAITNDAALEGPEQARLELTAPTGGAVLGATANALLVIHDDEAVTNILFENFSSEDQTRYLPETEAPPGWTRTIAAGADPVAQWIFNAPEGNNQTGAGGEFAVVNAATAEVGAPVECELRSPVLNLSGYARVDLQWHTAYGIFDEEICDVDLSLDGGTTWTNVHRVTGFTYGNAFNPGTEVFAQRTESQSLTEHAAGQSQVQLRFRYHNAWRGEPQQWQIDDVRLTGEADADHDRIPDWWESRHFGGTSSANATTDSDGDGSSDSKEYIADTDPRTPQSVLRLWLDSAVASGLPPAVCQSSPLRRYQWEVSTDLSMWSPLDSPITGTGGIIRNTHIPGTSRAFLRMRVLPP